jgi:NodT family efflux transporter outer membrane factor (OMF) lipoprotein
MSMSKRVPALVADTLQIRRKKKGVVMRIANLVAVAATAAIAAGCMTGPDYKRPDLPLPNQWNEPMDGGLSAKAPTQEEWWASFGDPALESLINRAAAGSFDLKIAEARIKQARAAEDIVGAALLPQVNSNAAYQRLQTRKIETPKPKGGSMTLSSRGLSVAGTLPGPLGTTLGIVPDLTGGGGTSVSVSPGAKAPERQSDLFQAGFDASWELDVFGGIRREKEAARADTEAAAEVQRDIFISVAAEVARNYFNLRSAQNRLDTALQNIEIQQQALNLASAKFKAGLTSELDVKTAEAQLAATRSSVPAFETAIQMSIHRLGVLIGAEPGALQQELSPKAPLAKNPPDVPVDMPADILRRRPDVRASERAVAAATARIGVAEADLYPHFVLTGSLTGSSTDLEGITRGANRLWSFGPSIHWPVFDGGRIRANIRVQNARQEETITGYQQIVMLAMEDVENALVAYAKEQNRLISLNEAVAANRRAVDIAKSLYQNGLINFLNVIDAERNLFASEDQQIQSEAQVLTNLVALYKALGGGWQKAYPEMPPPNGVCESKAEDVEAS